MSPETLFALWTQTNVDTQTDRQTDIHTHTDKQTNTVKTIPAFAVAADNNAATAIRTWLTTVPSLM